MQIINVKLDDIELHSALEHMFEHQNLVRQLIYAVFIEAQCTTARRDEVRLGHRVSTCKKRDLMALANQFLGEIRYNPLRTAVILWRHTLKKRRHLSNSHNRIKPSSIRTSSKFFDSVHLDQITSAHTKARVQPPLNPREPRRSVFYLRVNQGKRAHAIFRHEST